MCIRIQTMIQTGNIWYSPPKVYWYIQQLNKKGEKMNNLLSQQVEEIRLASVTALAMFAFNGMPAFVQLHKPDPPDAIVMQTTIPADGIAHISLLEITTYAGNPQETLLERLQRKKVPIDIKTLSPEYVLVINLGIGFNIDYELKSIRDYVNKKGVDFPIWIIQEKTTIPDSIAEVILIDKNIRRLHLNIGEIAYKYKKQKIFGVIETKKPTSKNIVRSIPNSNKYPPPWETIEK